MAESTHQLPKQPKGEVDIRPPFKVQREVDKVDFVHPNGFGLKLPGNFRSLYTSVYEQKGQVFLSRNTREAEVDKVHRPLVHPVSTSRKAQDDQQ